MKRIINGKMYNTETAKCIATYDSGHFHNGFNYYYEELYLKKTGEFFMCGEGGPLTRYCEVIPGGGRSYGRDIIPLTIDEAKEWVEEHMSADYYIEIFGEAEE